MFGPALAALLTRLIRREGFADAGLRLATKGQRGAGWIYVAAYVIPPILIAASIGCIRSGSVWPSTLAHAALNAQAGFALILLSPADSLVRAPIGLLGLVPLLIFAIFLVMTGRLKPAVPAPQPKPMLGEAA